MKHNVSFKLEKRKSGGTLLKVMFLCLQISLFPELEYFTLLDIVLIKATGSKATKRTRPQMTSKRSETHSPLKEPGKYLQATLTGG
jgi:hypothetical protein